MAIVTPALVKALFTGWNGDFQNGLDGAASQYEKIATIVPSTTKSNTYGWLGQFPGMREWIGDRVIKDMQAHGYQLVNRPFESTVGVNRDDIDDDNVGIYSPLFTEMGRAAGVQPDELTFGALSQGFDTLCYDRQNFFDTDHPVYPAVDGTGTAASVSNILSVEGYTGQPWFVLDCSRAIKPVIFQNRKSPELVAMDKVDDEDNFMRKLIRYGVDTRCEAGYSFWQLAYAAKAPLNADNVWQVIQSMRSGRADGGRPLAIRPTHLVVPPSMEKQATQLLERELTVDTEGGTVSNEMKGRLELIIGDYL
ncbi:MULTISPECIES: Mu-like prophage major head subunit gpT family protein [Yersinia pseudotuberculosis complex]|uniref:Mu-like prophage major head subunit gpT n=1 Tax=Yersinia pseudotuberculosis TaxID=633 RepID=A0A380Q3N2_YERPU|nr:MULTISPECIES: Mu-like prophage major head subunit gpT family protein [Yersinia pseudotuberculosis complex]MBK1425929.1 Mu-like prophage major head subunit gpT family protein [Yersinia pseudotuberculosis]MBK1426452.1 Mu-like prophage major head subunit gpT family protein [Yersinia pseudotuberculosis]CNC00481.1 Mu-like prophage major head subunit gpT [Yersinia similis]CNF92746.1 Mu-like prophage major head subunit gpT [Yersinia pseudotuberculosis]CNJ73799.1 Mu-like prophage major head subunit